MHALLNQKGFSLLEIVVSAGALGFFILLIQSMLLLANSFMHSQHNLADAFQTTQFIKKNMCVSNSRFINISLKQESSYTKKDTNCLDDNSCECQKKADGSCMKNADGQNINIVSSYGREYTNLLSSAPTPSSPPTGNPPGSPQPTPPVSVPPSQPPTSSPGNQDSPQPVIKLSIKGIEGEESMLSNAKIIQATKDSSDVETKDNKATYYKVFQDSHTIVRLNFNTKKQPDNKASADGTPPTSLTDKYSGYIFASRCVENSKQSVHKTAGNKRLVTFNPKAKSKSAMYILEVLEYRPFYFPFKKGENPEAIKCCTKENLETDPKGGTCKSAISDFVMRIYALHIEQENSQVKSTSSPSANPSNPPKDNGFSFKVSHIQELPEMHNINSIWGAGFMLSLKEKKDFSQSAFNLETMILNNRCTVSTVDVHQCDSLSLGGTPPTLATQVKATGNGGKQKNLIIPDISSCGGYSSGVDTTSLISL